VARYRRRADPAERKARRKRAQRVGRESGFADACGSGQHGNGIAKRQCNAEVRDSELLLRAEENVSALGDSFLE
jgi:hypothetical protein